VRRGHLPYLDDLRKRGGRRWTQAAAGEVSGNGGLCSRGLVLGFVNVIRRQGMIWDSRRVMVGLVRTCELESSLA
jgi:hypothetical protein